MNGVFYLYQWLKRVSPPHNLTPLVFPRLQGVKITDLKFLCQGFSDSLVTVDEFPDITGIPLSLSTSPFITLIPRHRSRNIPFPSPKSHLQVPWFESFSAWVASLIQSLGHQVVTKWLIPELLSAFLPGKEDWCIPVKNALRESVLLKLKLRLFFVFLWD